MEMFASYLKEREGVDLLYTEQGFAIYSIQGEECYIRDIYVRPDYRKSGYATIIADSIARKAKQQGCKIMTGSVSPKVNNATASMKILLAYGMRLHSANQDLIAFVKDIK